MAVPGGTAQTYQQIGEREDLKDIIYDISPTDTPFLSQVQKVPASAVYHEWQIDELDAAAANTAVEGDDASNNTMVPTTRVGNYCQISDKVVQVSGTARAVDTAGRADELSYQVAKRGRELKRDMEFALVQNQASSAGTASTARTSAGVESWLASNYVSEGTGTAQTTPGFSGGTVAAPTDSSVAGTFEEVSLKSAIQNCWTEGGDPKIVMVGAFNKTKVSAFAGIATLYRDTQGIQQATIIGAADMYISDFGEHAIVANRFQRDQTALVLDMDYWQMATLREMEMSDLAKTGDSSRKQLLSEFTLVSSNEKASSKVSDLTTS